MNKILSVQVNACFATKGDETVLIVDAENIAQWQTTAIGRDEYKKNGWTVCPDLILTITNSCNDIVGQSVITDAVKLLEEAEALMTKKVYPKPDKPDSDWGLLCRIRDILPRLKGCV